MPLNNTMYQGPAARGRPLLPGCVLSLGSAAFTIAATPVFGQVLEEVVVTAQHRTQSMQDVPIAITAFDADTIEKAKIEARRQGHGVTEAQLADGSVKLTINVGGAA